MKSGVTSHQLTMPGQKKMAVMDQSGVQHFLTHGCVAIVRREMVARLKREMEGKEDKRRKELLRRARLLRCAAAAGLFALRCVALVSKMERLEAGRKSGWQEATRETKRNLAGS